MNEWKLVPVEPTPEMIEAALDNRASQPDGTLPGSAMRQMFEAMVEVAPVPENKPVAHRFFEDGNAMVLRALYTHPAPPSELVKAAEDTLRIFADMGDVVMGQPLAKALVDTEKLLRNALDKLKCPAPAKNQ